MINRENYLSVCGIMAAGQPGGQELILFELLALLAPHRKIWLPFLSSGTLAKALESRGHRLLNPGSLEIPYEADALYFGTPTIVDGKALFDVDLQGLEWSKEAERGFVRRICRAVCQSGYKLILSGLGSGDISPAERIEDMGGGQIVVFKDFGNFQDWVLARRINVKE